MYHISVDDLRNLGYKVKVFHDRIKNKNGELSPKGGKTRVFLTDHNGNTAEGIAKCSTLDGFSRKLGVRIAIGRALNILNK